MRGLRLALERALALPREGSAAMAAMIRSEKGVERAAALLEGVAAVIFYRTMLILY